MNKKDEDWITVSIYCYRSDICGSSALPLRDRRSGEFNYTGVPEVDSQGEHGTSQVCPPLVPVLPEKSRIIDQRWHHFPLGGIGIETMASKGSSSQCLGSMRRHRGRRRTSQDIGETLMRRGCSSDVDFRQKPWYFPASTCKLQ